MKFTPHTVKVQGPNDVRDFHAVDLEDLYGLVTSAFGPGIISKDGVIQSRKDTSPLVEQSMFVWEPAAAAANTQRGEGRKKCISLSDVVFDNPSSVAGSPALYNILHEKVAKAEMELRDHRPAENHGLPISIMQPAFAVFEQSAATCTPDDEDFKVVHKFINCVSNVCEDELELQKEVLKILQQFLGSGYDLVLVKRADKKADIKVLKAGQVLVEFEIKTDAAGNARAQLVCYYIEDIKSAHSQLLGREVGMPIIGLEISRAVFFVHAAMVAGNKILFEPLTHGLQLYRHNNNMHIKKLAMAMHAFKEAIDKLLAPSDGSGLPFLFLEPPFAGCKVSLLCNSRPLVFLVKGEQQEPRVVKFYERRFDGLPGLLQVQRAWHAAGVAPTVEEVWAGYQWAACSMPYLSPEDGWDTLFDISQCGAISAEDWDVLCKCVQDALHKAHSVQITLGETQIKTVHGDMRLGNIVARRAGGSFEVMVLDFGWAGVDGQTRYPGTMSPSIGWPAGAKLGGVMWQSHDQQLLEAELAEGGERRKRQELVRQQEQQQKQQMEQLEQQRKQQLEEREQQRKQQLEEREQQLKQQLEQQLKQQLEQQLEHLKQQLEQQLEQREQQLRQREQQLEQQEQQQREQERKQKWEQWEQEQQQREHQMKQGQGRDRGQQ